MTKEYKNLLIQFDCDFDKNNRPIYYNGGFNERTYKSIKGKSYSRDRLIVPKLDELSRKTKDKIPESIDKGDILKLKNEVIIIFYLC